MDLEVIEVSAALLDGRQTDTLLIPQHFLALPQKLPQWLRLCR